MNDLTIVEIKILLESLLISLDTGKIDEGAIREVIAEIEALLESDGNSDT